MESYSFEVYQAQDGWRWRLVAGNGEIVADGSEAYSTKWDAERAVNTLKMRVAEM